MPFHHQTAKNISSKKENRHVKLRIRSLDLLVSPKCRFVFRHFVTWLNEFVSGLTRSSAEANKVFSLTSTETLKFKNRKLVTLPL